MTEAPPPPPLPCITASHWQGANDVRYLGVVTGEAILGANVFKDMFAGIRDIVGGRSQSYERELGRARQIAMAEMSQAAVAMGANAVIAVDIDYETVGQGSMLMVAASGTAVVVS